VKGQYSLLDIRREGGVVHLYFNRPEVHNAFNGEVIEQMIAAFQELADDPDARVIVLGGHGKSFCAGADLKWMMSMAMSGAQANGEDAKVLGSLFEVINSSPKPVIARVHGAVRGGGLGIVAACDIPVATENVTFAFTEVRLGLAPAVISPFCIARIGAPAARELFLTGAKFDAHRAERLSLVHHVAKDEEALDAHISELAANIVKGGPNALAACKRLAMNVGSMDGAEAFEYTSSMIAGLRGSDEGKEGMSAFMQRRKPSWCAE